MCADLSDRVSNYLHHCCSDVVWTGLQAAIVTQQTANIHGMQEHLLAVIGCRERARMSQMIFISSKQRSHEKRKRLTLIEVVVRSVHNI